MTIFQGTRRLTTEQVREVVRRGDLLERNALETISEDELRSIATELGISEFAVQQALSATLPTADSTPLWKRPATVAISSWFGGAGAAVGLSTLSRLLHQPYLAYTALITLIAMVCVSTALGFEAKSSVARRRFQLGNLALWGGFGFAAATMGHYEVALPGFVIGAVAALVGWLVHRRGKDTEPQETVLAAPDAASETSWKDRLMELFRNGMRRR